MSKSWISWADPLAGELKRPWTIIWLRYDQNCFHTRIKVPGYLIVNLIYLISLEDLIRRKLLSAHSRLVTTWNLEPATGKSLSRHGARSYIWHLNVYLRIFSRLFKFYSRTEETTLLWWWFYCSFQFAKNGDRRQRRALARSTTAWRKYCNSPRAI